MTEAACTYETLAGSYKNVAQLPENHLHTRRHEYVTMKRRKIAIGIRIAAV
jgi:hypothetical protein